ncbi:L-arabinose-binding periplasmic protein precursor [Lacunisphaera limnophila]|uniref:L-arabinose-binding periplasmic protein n=1 Tax=Lacunisphaera limnophila TaxID=1838286 RepID=A0A1D8AZW9_9BACT|nr:arabinose ABC transporter substrate-binding protein [Lacunisphaera limnophila]AOS46433.1 L-arabinose-binding periplasmic protein precursor [Lacunisphaera limnophila]
MKIPAPLVLILLSAGLLAGCSKQTATPAPASAPAKIKIGFLVKQPEEPWFQFEWKGADAAAKQYGFEVVKLGVTDGEKVMTAIDSLVAGGAQGFVICTPDVRLGPAIAARAKLKGLKLITVDDQFVSADGKFMTEVPYLGMSASKIGAAQGEALYAEMQRRGWPVAETAVCAITFEELDTARERTDASIAALRAAGFPADRIFKAPQKTTDIPGSLDAANILLTQHPDVKRWLVLGMNDNAVLGAIRATEGRGFTAENVIGIGINGTDCIDELRKAKPTGFHGSMLVSAPQEGFQTAEMLYHWIKDGTVPPADTRTSGILITRENFEQVLRKEGIID